MTIKKGIICEDESLQNKIYPYTQMDCVFDSDNSTTLDVVVDDIKENLMYVDEIGAYENVVPINADLLEGHDGNYYKQTSMELIYSNSDTTQPVTNSWLQTSEIDWENVKMFILVMRLHAQSSHEYLTSRVLPVFDRADGQCKTTGTVVVEQTRYDGSTNTLMARAFLLDELAGGNNLNVSSGYTMGTYGTWSNTANNSVLIPSKLFAIY